MAKKRTVAQARRDANVAISLLGEASAVLLECSSLARRDEAPSHEFGWTAFHAAADLALAKAAGLRSGEFGFTEREGEGGTR